MGHVHSVLVRVGADRCAATARLAAPWLRPYVAGYGAFRTGTTADAAQRRVLPLNLVTLIVDFDGCGSLAFGPRGTPEVREGACWLSGVTIGLTPAGARGLLGVPMRVLTGTAVDLDGLLGRRADELAERLVAAPGWDARFAVLDDLLTRWLRPDLPPDQRRDQPPDDATVRGWWRLQETAGRIRIGRLAAELGVSRRRLESGFQREIGLTPKTVARVARFQRAAQVLGTPASTPGILMGAFAAAAACGFADQPHFNREVRAMAGITPGELRAFLQYADQLSD
ncbi:helix-turn-helix domain-containing protein [Actinomadura sp. 9N215]|uniref:helix-turn-helix transcriptional regulator n=1 Tax=Actinomadura sp. 9N215 TaxID=3375150 RepID=UPI0037BCF422